MSCESCKKYRAVLEDVRETMRDGMSSYKWQEAYNAIANFLDSIPEPVEEERTCKNCELPTDPFGCADCYKFNNWKARAALAECEKGKTE